MIDLVYWSFLAALLPIGLHVGLRYLSLIYWSFLAPIGSIVMHICARIRVTDAGSLVWRSDRPVSVNRHPRLIFLSRERDFGELRTWPLRVRAPQDSDDIQWRTETVG